MRILLSYLLLTIAFNLFGQTWTPVSPNSLRTTVLLEKIDAQGNFIPHGTGFLLRTKGEHKNLIVVTNEHVLRNSYIYVTIAADSAMIEILRSSNSNHLVLMGHTWTLYGNKFRRRVNLFKDSTVVKSQKYDVAAFMLYAGESITDNDSKITYQLSNILGLRERERAFKKDILAGTDVYYIGFPYAIGTEKGYFGMPERFYNSYLPNPVVRKGSVAWINKSSEEFLLDAFSFSGNSGSPIYVQESHGNAPKLIGIVTGHLPSKGSDNMGLATCIWYDEIDRIINKLEAIVTSKLK